MREEGCGTGSYVLKLLHQFLPCTNSCINFVHIVICACAAAPHTVHEWPSQLISSALRMFAHFHKLVCGYLFCVPLLMAACWLRRSTHKMSLDYRIHASAPTLRLLSIAKHHNRAMSFEYVLGQWR